MRSLPGMLDLLEGLWLMYLSFNALRLRRLGVRRATSSQACCRAMQLYVQSKVLCRVTGTVLAAFLVQAHRCVLICAVLSAGALAGWPSAQGGRQQQQVRSYLALGTRACCLM